MDEPERQLWQIRPARNLGPGVYAIHWGAFEGDTSTDSSAYLIELSEATGDSGKATVAAGDGGGEEEKN